jgi:hypothetical protein
VARLSKALKTCTGAEKVYVEAYYEVVPHLHLLLTARYPGTPQMFRPTASITPSDLLFPGYLLPVTYQAPSVCP